jgi:hypothetical protein
MHPTSNTELPGFRINLPPMNMSTTLPPMQPYLHVHSPHDELTSSGPHLTLAEQELALFTALLNGYSKCEITGLDGRDQTLNQVQNLSVDKQNSLLYQFQIGSLHDPEVREVFKCLRDVLWAETKHQENLLNEITMWCNNQITDIKRSLYPSEDKSNSLGRSGIPSPSATPSPPTRHYKGRKRNLPPHATAALRKWLFEHTENPYPTEDEKQILMQQTNLNLKQVNNWFINARRRILKPGSDGLSGGDISPSMMDEKHFGANLFSDDQNGEDS